ncbi:MipA/OmpV family protein [Pseudomonas sp. Fl5BN2]|uniref:MipA/OmpV family protein n=1 Tax=unclassified Pseudomonas TaxID=196821 RepID=UPI001376EC1B|nr:MULTISPECIES: MipA/OmpV family protein [unclassified Pseudomonas]NBF06464.1 MipA/OmpV family protein [Pseudomonas sp. Fl5BN2]NBF09030.1 MipA/OmpV family protein [Pseudomonas sp. Fl4BN1]
MKTLKRSTTAAALWVSTIGLTTASAPLHAEDWKYGVHAGVASVPRYSGSDERTVAPLLGGEIVSPYGIFLNTDQGLGWGSEWGDLSFSTWVGASEERRDKNHMGQGSKRLKGMGEIKSRAQFGAHLGYDLGPFELGATLTHAMKKNDRRDTGSAYSQLELSIGTQLYEGGFGSLDVSVNSLFGNADYLQTWYGVSDTQAANSRFSTYRAKGGRVSSGADLAWTLPLNEQTKLSTLLSMKYLSKEAGDSPIVDRRMQTSIGTQIEYSF